MVEKQQTTNSMEPIPLRTLTVLLNYERLVSDPRFKDQELVVSSIADPSVISRGIDQNPGLFANELSTIKHRYINQFAVSDDHPSSDPLPTIFSIHPDAERPTKALSFADRELIYHLTHGHDGCFVAIGLYQLFLELCPPEQELSLQITNETPIIVNPQEREITEFSVQGPVLQSISIIPSGPLTLMGGFEDNSVHAVLSFPVRGGDDFVVDMTRMQYGTAGRGTYGENYFFGLWDDYNKSMAKICSGINNIRNSLQMNMTPEFDRARAQACAQRVWERWQKREEEGWCEHCGKPGVDSKLCGGCKEAKVRYCCREHQVAGWKLHKYTCEKKKSE
ncbi:hypothetical protein LSUE1_G009562 [Lachnellula suecica]|uniref:MYND-type domain-containing protein n=1 Tax=Lachnellula suecica TaxID=602035 RepID=A0A8T9BYF1_9HELO|nr:hypothetical protein LSUE1_G009562 [Lachnellula suecica]